MDRLKARPFREKVQNSHSHSEGYLAAVQQLEKKADKSHVPGWTPFA
jgi:hypothetical protein